MYGYVYVYIHTYMYTHSDTDTDTLYARYTYIQTYVYMYIFHAWSWLRVVCSFERKRSMICTVRNSVSVRSLNLRTPTSPAWKVRCAPRRKPSPAHAKMCVCGCARCHVGSDVIYPPGSVGARRLEPRTARSRVLYTSEDSRVLS